MIFKSSSLYILKDQAYIYSLSDNLEVYKYKFML